MGIRKFKLRSWNWIPHKEQVIKRYLKSLSPNLYEFQLLYKPMQLRLSVQTDYFEFLNKIENHFISKESDFTVVNDHALSSIKLIYLVESAAIYFPEINNLEKKLSLTYNRTDIAFDPKTFTALFHGPPKFGFIKSLILGIVSAYLSKYSIYGLHSALVSNNLEGVLFAGSHNAGKSSLSLMYALTAPGITLLSDDWVICKSDKKNLFAKPLEMNAYLDPKVVIRILDVVPSSKILNGNLVRKLEEFLKNSDKPQVKKILGADNRMYLNSTSLHYSKNFIKIIKLLILVGEHKKAIISTKSKNLINLIMDLSYHIPFHSPKSRTTLQKIQNSNSLDNSNISLIELINKKQNEEKKFWIEAMKYQPNLIFDTSNDNLWDQYCLLKKNI